MLSIISAKVQTACLHSQHCTSIKASLDSKQQRVRDYHHECQLQGARATNKIQMVNIVYIPRRSKNKTSITQVKYRIRASTQKEHNRRDRTCKPPKIASTPQPHKSRDKQHRTTGPNSNLETRVFLRPRTLTHSYKSSRRQSRRSNRKTSLSTRKTSWSNLTVMKFMIN